MAFVWTDNLAVGHARIDSEHRALIAIINRLEAAIAAGVDHDALGSILCDLSEYCAHHFDHEEQEMMRCRYGGYRRHKTQHDDLIQRLSELVYRFEARRAGLSGDTLAFLTGWLTDHILVEDRKLSAVLDAAPMAAGSGITLGAPPATRR
jgi:hemerythrin-like metal-binding protein